MTPRWGGPDRPRSEVDRAGNALVVLLVLFLLVGGYAMIEGLLP